MADAWSASVRVVEGGVTVQFIPPARRITMTPETARAFAANLLVAAERAEHGEPNDDELDPTDPQAMTVSNWFEEPR